MNWTPTLGKKFELGQVNLDTFDHNNQMITFSVITLSGFHCARLFYFLHETLPPPIQGNLVSSQHRGL
jgi:hypothetical protein